MEEQNPAGGSSEVKNMQGDKTKQNSSMRIFVWLGAAVAVLALVAGIGIYKVYAKSANDKFSLAVAKALNLPVVKVGNEKISYTSYAEDLKAIHVMRDYDKSQRAAGAGADRSPGADLTEEQMTDQVLWRLVNNLLIDDAAKKYDVTVEDKDLQNLKTQMLQQFKDEAAAGAELKKRYGWDMAMYEKKVMRPFITQTKLAQKLKNDPKTKEELKAAAEKALLEVKNGGNFADLAKEFNTDSTADRGGDLGWFGKGEMVPEFEKAVFSLKKGETYPTLVESMYGYHIIKLDDKRTQPVKDANGKTTNQAQVRASQILFRFPDLLSYLDKQVKDNKIHLYLNVHNPFAPLTPGSTETTSGTQE